MIQNPETLSHVPTMLSRLPLPNELAILKMIQDGVWVSDETHQIVFVNEPLCQIAGVDASALVGHNLLNFAEETVQHLRGFIMKAVVSLQPCAFECPIVTPAGRTTWQGGWMTPLVKEGRYAGMISTVRDITEKMRHEETIKQQARRLADILEGTRVGTWEWDIQTGEVTFNERWAEIVGYTLAELAPTNIDTWSRLAHPDDLKFSSGLLDMHFNGDLPYYECEARMKHKDGHWVWVLDRGRVSRWTADGKPLFMSGTHQDISEMKQTEALLRDIASRVMSHPQLNSEG